MKFNTKIAIITLTFLALIGCQSNAKKEKKLPEEQYGIWKLETDSIAVELKLKKYQNWKELIERTEKIVCNDSLPKLTLKNENLIKTVYFRNPCWKNFGCILIKEKNVIEIHNDSVIKSNKFYILDSLENILKRDIENNGKNPSLCDNPKKLLIKITYDDKFGNLLKTLDKLTSTYNKVTTKTNINIWLNNKIEFIPPPPNISRVNNKQNIEKKVAEFSKSFSPKDIGSLNSIPVEIVKSFSKLRLIDKNAHKKYVTLIFTKLYAEHLTCCHQSYIIAERSQNDFDKDKISMVNEFGKMSGYLDKEKPEIWTSGIIEKWIKENPYLLKNILIKNEFERIKFEQKNIANGKYWKK